MREPQLDLNDYYTIPNASVWQTVSLNLSHCYHAFFVTKPNPPQTEMTADKALILSQQAANTAPSTAPNFVWDKIVDGLYLGQVPTTNPLTDAQSIVDYVHYNDPKRPLGLVISAIDYFELVNLWLTEGVTPDTWKRHKVRHYHVRMTDHTGDSSLRVILQAVAEMRRTIALLKQSVYEHCKAGVGRSALLALVYLMIFGDERRLEPYCSLEDAHAFLKKKRGQLNMNEKQLRVVQEVVKLARREDFYNSYPSYFSAKQKPNTIDEYLASEQGKDDIRHLVSFKELALYASKNLKFYRKCLRSEHIRQLFSMIHTANDASWLRVILKENNRDCPLQALLNAIPFNATDADLNVRKRLVSEFKEEIVALIADRLTIERAQVATLLEHHSANAAALRT